MPTTESPFKLKASEQLSNQKLLDLIRNYQAEARSVWEEPVDGKFTLQELWQLGKRMFYGDQIDQSIVGIENPVLNRTQNSVIANTAAQTERTPSVVFSPGSTQGGTAFVMSQKGTMRLQMSGMVTPEGLMNPETGEALLSIGQITGQELIPEILSEMMISSQMLTSDDTLPVNSSVAVELLQRAYDAEWKQMQGDYHLRINILQNNIFGHQPIFYQWDRERNKGVLENPPIKTVMGDPIHVDIDRFRFLIFNFLLSVDEAKQRYPGNDAEIEEAAGEGNFDSAYHESSVTSSPSVWSNTSFKQPLVQITVMWRRHIRYPMTVKEAVRLGAVDLDEMGQIRLPNEEGVPGQGEVTAPDQSDWPTISHVEEVHAIPTIDKILKRQRCAYEDIPMAWNRNIHMVDRPYGISECARLYHVQRVINSLFRSILNIVEQYQFPPEFLPLSVHERLKQMGKDSRRIPRRQIFMSQEELNEILPALQHLASWAPPMPASYVEMLRIALDEHDRLSGDVDVQQGDTPSGVTSGVAIQQLQAAARGPLGLKSRGSEATLERLSGLIIDSMLKFMSPFHWQRYSNGYPEAGMAKLLEILDEREFTIRAEISSGRGINTEAAKQTAFAARQQADLSQKTFLEKTKIVDSPDQEQKRIEREQQKLMEAQARAAAAAGGQQQQQQQP